MGFYGSYPIEGGGTTGIPTNFGDGSDGAAILDGTNTYPWAIKSGSVYSLNRPIYLTNLTINSGIKLVPSLYSITCSGVLLNAGTIEQTGTPGGAGGIGGIGQGQGGAAGVGFIDNSGTQTVSPDIGPNTSGTIGANNDANGVGNASPAGSLANTEGGAGGNGGTGVTTPAGTSGGTFTDNLNRGYFRKLTNNILTSFSGNGGNGGSDGGGGSSDGVNNGGGGGAGGASGGVVFIICNTLNNTGTIAANGGAGGAGETPAVHIAAIGGGGGGGGGSGGLIYIVCQTNIASGTIQVNGGAGGAGGAGAAGGTNGSAGLSGTVGLIQHFVTSTGTWL